MEGSFLCAVVEQTLHRVLSLISDEMIMLASNLLDDLRGIQVSIFAVIDMLQDADEQQTRREPVRLWLINLEEVAYAAEDVIDELSYKILRRKVHFFGNNVFLKMVGFNFQLAQKVKNLNQLLQTFENEGNGLGLQWISPVFDDDVLGRENQDVSRIFSLLTDTNNSQIFTIVPIVGKSGIWKTTLAKSVCRKAMETNLFDVKIWVIPSELSRGRNIFHEMLQYLNGNMGDMTNTDVILEQLEKELSRRRFLLVLDNVGDDATMWWDGFKTCLSKMSLKSRNAIIVTTCSDRVASIIDTSSQHTNITRQNDKAPFVENLGSWRMRFYKQEEAGLTSREIVKINRMPSDMKSCIEFCLSFPEGFPFQKEELIQLWMVEGLIESHDKGLTCFDALVQNAFLQDVKMDGDADVVTCKSENLFRNYGSRNYTSPIHRLFATSMDIQEDRALRTLILHGFGFPFQESWKSGSRRTLFLNIADVDKLLSSIGRLKHLRHLDVSKTKIRALPKFITELYNLQTLKFLECKELKKLPRKKFHNLINLKTIAFSFEHQMPYGLGKLKGLKTLSFFVVGSDRGGSIKELKWLNELEGFLEITRLEEVRDQKEAETANLQQKAEISGLSFQWSYGAYDRTTSDEKVLEGLRPHPDIEKMKIKYYMGEKWPSWMQMLRTPSPIDDSFVISNLVNLKLEQCWKCVQLPPLGKIPCLKFLTIQHMGRVKFIGNESYKAIDIGETCSSRHEWLFPALKSLSLSWMENLIGWTSLETPFDGKKVVVFPVLETLSIQSCVKLTSFPMHGLSELVKVEIKDCHELRFLLHEQESFPSLTSLSIEGCPKLTHLRNWLLSNTHLNRFGVRRCEWLKFISDDLGLQSSLISLEINCCKNLTFFPQDILCKLARLRRLSIGAFSQKLDDFRYLNGIEHLPWLDELEIWGSDFLGRKMCHLPDQLQNLANLDSLKIMGFTTMEALPEWLSDLQSLRFLSLSYCLQLEYESIAKIIPQLPKFRDLYIYGCPTLEQDKCRWTEFSCNTKIKIHFPE